MAHLGEFGRELAELDTATPDEGDTFTFHGVTFTLPRDIGAMPLMRYSWRVTEIRREADAAVAALAAARTDEERAAALDADTRVSHRPRAALYEYIRACIGESQWPEFERVAIAAASDQSELMEVARRITAEVSARPTRRPSASAGGPSGTGGGSLAASPSPDTSSQPVPDGRPVSDRERAIAGMGMVPLDVAAARDRAERAAQAAGQAAG